MKHKLFILFILSLGCLRAQTIKGLILDADGQPLVNASVSLGSVGTISDVEGRWQLKPQEEEAKVLEIQHISYLNKSIEIKPGQNFYKIQLEKSALGLDEVVVSGSRRSVPRHNAPLIINTINPKTFENIAALSLAEGLNFSPGLRLENNCQNCGFTQVRINGLEGAYSQILLNSRPIFSSLMGVYGLEMFPPTMIDRVEVLKGGGSAIYGGNAIGGTINIITKEALQNNYFFQSQLDLIGGQAIQHNQSLGSSLVNDAGNLGLNFFAFNRNREAWDANGDGFTEITELQTQSLGFNSYYKPKQREKWSWDLFYIREFRRGGSDLNLKPHQSRIAEQLKHNIIGSGLSFEKISADNRRQWSAYVSAQATWRDSYYGGGGRIIPPGDSLNSDDLLALNAYGESEDYSAVAGFFLHQELGNRWNISLGSEYTLNQVRDAMPGYQRLIEQTVQNWGTYLQSEFQFHEDWQLQLGARLDGTQVRAQNQLADLAYRDNALYWNLSPRMSLKHQLSSNFKLRASYARGFRAPQAFNEDLHIAVVGGSALFVQLSPDLELETSNSYNLSGDWSFQNQAYESNLVLNGFYTQLNNNFILSDQQELADGSARLIKRNGAGAKVFGTNLEYSMAWRKWSLQSSLTLQRSLFQAEEVIWSNADSSVSSEEVLRAPNLYGYLSANYQLNDHWDLKLNANYTGPMLVPHVVDPDTEFTVLERSPNFLDLGLSLEWLAWHNAKGWRLRIHGGVRNLFNSYQDDFDIGADRDAGYIYGPLQPRSYFISLRLDRN